MINRCPHCGCDEPIYNAIDGKLYCNNCGMSLEKLKGGLAMTLEEAIKHCEEVAKEKCDVCGAEHKQLVEWLKEIKWRREIMGLMARNLDEVNDKWLKHLRQEKKH
jgi:ribosomal protein S27E